MKNVTMLITQGKTTDVTIVMESADNHLDQVVVTGYAQTYFKRMTGSVAVLDSDKFKSQAVSSVDALMQGEVAGVNVKNTSGQPGTQTKSQSAEPTASREASLYGGRWSAPAERLPKSEQGTDCYRRIRQHLR